MADAGAVYRAWMRLLCGVFCYLEEMHDKDASEGSGFETRREGHHESH